MHAAERFALAAFSPSVTLLQAPLQPERRLLDFSSLSPTMVLLVMLAGMGVVCAGLALWLLRSIRVRKVTDRRLASAYRELDRTRGELDRSRRIDEVTGLVSGMAVREDLHYAEVRVERSGEPFSFVLVRLENLVAIRRTHGTTPADYLLSSVAKVLRGHLRKQDIVSRWTDNEFLLLLPETDAPGADVVLTKMQRLLESPQVLENYAVVAPEFLFRVCVYDGSRPVAQCIAEAGASPLEDGQILPDEPA